MLPFIIIIIALLLLSGFFSASETAVFSLSPVQLHHLRETNRRPAHLLTQALRHPRKILITILLGNELVNVSLSIVCAALIARSIGGSFFIQTVISVAVVTPLVLLLGEVIPKNVALRFAPVYSLFAIVPLTVFSGIVRPVRIVLTAIADACIRLLGGSIEQKPTIMEREYRRLIDIGRREGELLEEEREIIHNVFDFSDKVVSSVMTPIEDSFMLPVDLPYDELVVRVKQEGYSRIPIYEGDRSAIIGILHLRDLFAFDRKRRAGNDEAIRSILIEPIFVQSDEKLESLLTAFKHRRVHMAIVKHNDGALAGLVTMDDVLEDIFGELEVEES